MAQGYCSRCEQVTEGTSRGIQYQCGECGKYTQKPAEGAKSDSFTDNGYSAEYVVSSEKRVTSIEEVEALCTFDKNVWQIDRWQQQSGTSEGYRKDRQVEWHVEDGKVISGDVSDSGKMLVVPLHSFKIRIWLSRKTAEIRNEMVVNEFTIKALKFSPKYPKIKYSKEKIGHLFELGLPDLQLGRLVDAEEANADINPDLQVLEAETVVDKLISYATMFNVDRILFPVGNDYFDTNDASMFTKHGTPQSDDVRWKRTYQLGCSFIVNTVEKLMQIAPVDLLIIPGNHDEDKIWHLGEYVDAWFNKCDSVSVDNRMHKRKYYSYGKDLLMLTHGYFERNNKLDSLMAYEVPQLWANSTHREVHLGDKHHKVDMVLKTNELENGVVVRVLRSLASPSVWEYDKGYVGSMKAAEAFIWHENDGVIAQFTATK